MVFMGRRAMRNNRSKRNAEDRHGKSLRISRDPRHRKTVKARGQDYHDKRKIVARLRYLKGRLSERLQGRFDIAPT
jgi:hypothetical protein